MECRQHIRCSTCLSQQKPVLLKAPTQWPFVKSKPWQLAQHTKHEGKVLVLRRKAQHRRYVVLECHATGTEERDSKNTYLPPHSHSLHAGAFALEDLTAWWQLRQNCSYFLWALHNFQSASNSSAHVYLHPVSRQRKRLTPCWYLKPELFQVGLETFCLLDRAKHLPKVSAWHLWPSHAKAISKSQTQTFHVE